MAFCTVRWGWLIEPYGLHFNLSHQLVTFVTSDILVCTAQRELGPGVVIEQRRFPFHAVVAFRTARNSSPGELLAVNLLVTIFALRGNGLEIHVA